MTTPTLTVLPGGPPVARQVRRRGARGTYRTSVAGITPERLASFITLAEQGHTEQWADFCEYMQRIDAHVRSTVDTLFRTIAAAELDISPGLGRPGEESLAEDAAELIEEVAGRIPRFETTRMHLLTGFTVGWGAAEQVFTQSAGVWIPQHFPVFARDVRFAEDWTAEIRTFGGARTGDWIRSDAEPARWVMHMPASIGSIPTLNGVLMSVAWPFLFKLHAENFEQYGLERFASPLVVGKGAPNQDADARDEMFEALDNLMANAVGVLEDGQSVEFVQAAKSPTDSWGPAIDRYNAEISKAILGSTLNVEIGDAGGNRAAAESQAERTIQPRLRSIAVALAADIEDQIFGPTLRFNARHFGGRIPPTPRLELRLEQDPRPDISSDLLSVGGVTINEMREQAGLPPWQGPRGSQIARPMIKGGIGETQIDIVDDPSFDAEDEASLAHLGAKRRKEKARRKERKARQRARTLAAFQAANPEYVWMTEHDARVRPEHAARHRQRFRWDAPPPDGAPGEAYNCRCRAVPVLTDPDTPPPAFARKPGEPRIADYAYWGVKS